MLPILTSKQIHDADAYTIAHEPIASVDLMERAAKAFAHQFTLAYRNNKKDVAIYCGTGNNGGDGLAIARLLKDLGRKVNVKIARFSDKATDDFNTNLTRLQQADIPILEIKSGDSFPEEEAAIIIDALLGTGLNKPLQDEYKKLVDHLNGLNKTIVAVDVPTGLFAEGEIPDDATVLKADLVITFQQPKINFLLPESGPHMKDWVAVDIGINEEYLLSFNSPYQYVEEKDIKQLLKPRDRFSNKGTYGHALMVAGQAKTMGAALLSSSACTYAGAGLTTVCIPEEGLIALNSYMPELMAVSRKGNEPPDIEWEKFSVMGIGPGLGKDEGAVKLIKSILTNYHKSIVLDADGLNILANHPELWMQIPKGSIITPHMKEFDRLFGDHQSWWQRLETLSKKAAEHQINIVLKNSYTMVATPEGKIYFNSTSNSAMAVGGMGDVLTGIITSFLSQKHSVEDAALIGVYVHGKAGDELALPNKLHVVLPSQVASHLPYTLAKLIKK